MPLHSDKNEVGVAVKVLYEALVLDGRLALLVACETDNTNRTLNAVKLAVTRNGGVLGAAGAVAWMFAKRGVVRVAALAEERQLELIDSGAEDFAEDGGGVTIFTAPEKFWNVLQVLEGWGVAHSYAELDFVATQPVQFAAAEQEKISKLVNILKNTVDVKSVWTNAA